VVVPGWRVDPTGTHAYRYHDGASWTVYFADPHAVGTDPWPPDVADQGEAVGPPLAGWWPDPSGGQRARYHDGERWVDERPVPIRDGLSPGALGLAVLSSVVGTVLIAKLGTSQGATLAGAAISPMIAALFTTRRKKLAGGLRVGAVTLLTLAAVCFTVLGFTGAEKVTGKSLINNDQSTTFPIPDENTTTTTGPTTDTGTEITVTDIAGNPVPDEILICAGDAVDLNAEATDSNGTTELEPDVVWSAADESVATVDPDGVVAAVGAVGTATDITATLDGISDSVLVTVC